MLIKSDALSGVVDKGDTFILLILLWDELDFRGVALRNGVDLLDTRGNARISISIPM